MRAFLFLAILMFMPALFGAGVSIQSKANEIAAGETFEVSANFKIPDGSYVYYKDSGETGLPTTLDWKLPKGYALAGESWPEPEEVTEEGLKAFVYKKDFSVRANIRAADMLDGKPAEISLKAEWLKCTKSQCEPQDGQAKIEIQTKQGGLRNSPAPTLLFAILGAFAGGMILNLMPCVFPVIGLKILSFASDSASSRKTALKNALIYALGILASFISLAALLVWLKGMGSEIGWGFQLQNPVFVVLLIFLFAGMGMAFAGLVEMGSGFASLGSKLKNKGASAFLSGVLAVLVASPCTAPFMGASLGVALASESGPFTIFVIFTALGLGMAFPYVLLSAIPRLARLLPKPGAWMESFKQFLAFPMFATAIWLLWIFMQQAGADAAANILFAVLAFAFALWILGKWANPLKGKGTRILAVLAFVLTAATSLFWALGAAKPKAADKLENAWSEARVDELRREGKTVYVDFTAAWCLTCIANKKAVLDTDATKELFAKNNIALLRADWTNKDPLITRKLAEFGRSGVPLNVIYPSDPEKSPIVLPEILTKSALIEAIDKAGQ